MSWRLIISFSVVGLIFSSSAAFFCTPPAASSVDSMSRRSTLVITSLNDSPSGGTTKLGMRKLGAVRTWSGMRSGADARPRAQHHRALDDVLQLADVARPAVVHQQVERLRLELDAGLAVLRAVLLEEVLRQRRNVVLALPQRRQVDVDDVQPVVEVLAEPARRPPSPSGRSWSRRRCARPP